MRRGSSWPVADFVPQLQPRPAGGAARVPGVRDRGAGRLSVARAVAARSDDQQFALAFILRSGSLKEMAKRYGVSYPTVRNRLDSVIARLSAITESHETGAADDREDAPTPRVTTRTLLERTPVPRERTPMAREGTPMPHETTSSTVVPGEMTVARWLFNPFIRIAGDRPSRSA